MCSMRIPYPDGMVGREAEWARLDEFVTGGERVATLGVVWGRRRIGKSFLLEAVAERTGGFYYEAVRGSGAEALRDLGERLGAYQRAAAPLALADWESAISAMLAVGGERETVVMLDEFPYLLEHSPALDSILQRALGARRRGRGSSRVRLILCGSAMSIMRNILAGTAPLHGRASLDLRMSPFDFRVARRLHGVDDLRTAFRVFSVIGGVAAYAREMVGNDLPGHARDFDRWVTRRVLSPAAPLFHEATLLLSDDPITSQARKINLYHATLAGVATGHHAHRTLTSYVKIPGASLAPIIDTLVAAELITRVQDPIRDNRPTYHPADPLIRFHYAVIRRHHERLARHDADTMQVWRSLAPPFESHIVGPVFEDAARFWTGHIASQLTIGGSPDHVGPTTLVLPDGSVRELDVVVAADDAREPSARTVLAIGEAKSGERITVRHLRRLEEARSALGDRAGGARLILFGVRFAPDLRTMANARHDVELVDLDRLYHGS